MKTTKKHFPSEVSTMSTPTLSKGLPTVKERNGGLLRCPDPHYAAQVRLA